MLEIHSIAGPGIGRNLSSESRDKFRTTPNWLSAIYIVTMIAAVALQAVIK